MFNDLNFRLALPELQFIVDDSGASVLCADARHWDTADRAARPLPVDPRSSCGWTTGRRPTARPRGTSSPRTTRRRCRADLDADCVAGITYTGGTTGLPKGVMQTHGNLMVNAKHMLWANPLFESDRFLHLSPMFHSAGVANMYALRRSSPARTSPAPASTPTSSGRMIEQHHVTVACSCRR